MTLSSPDAPDLDVIIFGGAGDLSFRKLLPALYMAHVHDKLSEHTRIIALGRQAWSRDDYLQFIREHSLAFIDAQAFDANDWQRFLQRLWYVCADVTRADDYAALTALCNTPRQRVFYLATAPQLFSHICAHLDTAGLIDAQSRVVLEKPLGTDLESARAINQEVARHFQETQIYRIDHYLGKETVQNLMAVRFANILFEPIWKAQYIDHVQITVAETVGVEGRGAYYDKSGAMRDMVQNHMMQLLCLIAMEPPYHFDPDAVRDEKVKVIRALQPITAAEIVRGQYLAGKGDGGYVEHSEDPNSKTESYIALKVEIANWRWKGTPFYLRTGKKLRARYSEIAITFKEPPHSIFDDANGWKPNVLVIRLQPNEGMNLMVMIKEPGPGGMRLMQVPLDMTFADALGADAEDVPDAYERLIMDVIRGNQTLFMRGDEVEAAWAWTDPIIQGWETRGDRPQGYDAGSSGPEDALMLLHRDGRRWREIKE